MPQSRPLAFPDLDVRAVARTLARLAGPEAEGLDAFFERRETLELPPPGEAPGVRLVREEGFALRLLQGGRAWVASRDGLDPERFAAACRQVSRRPPDRVPQATLAFGAWPEPAPAPPLQELPVVLERALHEKGTAFPFAMRARHHRRWVQVIGDRVTPPPQRESFFSLSIEHPAGRYGSLLTALTPEALGGVAEAMAEQVRTRQAPRPSPGRTSVTLGAAAAAVFLHEAVAHSLEADTLALSGRPEVALGVAFAAAGVTLLDDPSAAPEEVSRTFDDEGMAVLRRWLLRDGVIEQPLADLRWASQGQLEPGAGWRSDRHQAPSPRTYHLELLPGEATRADLLAGSGLYVARIERGLLDPLRGEVTLHCPSGRLFSHGELGARLGRFVLHGRVEELLQAVEAVGAERQVAGAGWCAKGGTKVPVWATTPALRLGRIEVELS